MIRVAALIFLWSLSACRQNGKQIASENLPITMNDTSLLSYMIYSAVGENDEEYNSNWREYGYENSFDFSIDETKVYFYFDEFTVGGNPYGLEGSVKKKYISRLIRNDYK